MTKIRYLQTANGVVVSSFVEFNVIHLKIKG